MRGRKLHMHRVTGHSRVVPVVKKYNWISIFILVLISLLSVRAGYAQDTPPPTPSDDDVNAVAKQLYCPVCENTPLDVCPTQACAEWRELIRDKLSEGWTQDQIKRYFVEQYGDRVLGTPPARGLNWLVYFIPPVVFLVGVYILYRAFQSLRTKSSQTETAEVSPVVQNDKYIERVEEELRKL